MQCLFPPATFDHDPHSVQYNLSTFNHKIVIPYSSLESPLTLGISFQFLPQHYTFFLADTSSPSREDNLELMPVFLSTYKFHFGRAHARLLTTESPCLGLFPADSRNVFKVAASLSMSTSVYPPGFTKPCLSGWNHFTLPALVSDNCCTTLPQMLWLKARHVLSHSQEVRRPRIMNKRRANGQLVQRVNYIVQLYSAVLLHGTAGIAKNSTFYISNELKGPGIVVHACSPSYLGD